jgi:hypothetical protein
MALRRSSIRCGAGKLTSFFSSSSFHWRTSVR